MQSETLPAAKQPDEPPNVAPCHTGAAKFTCGVCTSLLEMTATCISCGAPWGTGHYSWCQFR